MAGDGTWRYHVYKDNKEIKVSEYKYDSQEAALADAAHYVKITMPRDTKESWHTAASHK
jgi:hypothetical protein